MWICYSHIFFYYISVFMVEIEKKYKIYEKNFGYINWLGFFTLYKKETFRFLKVAVQTILSPLLTGHTLCHTNEGNTTNDPLGNISLHFTGFLGLSGSKFLKSNSNSPPL